MASPTPPFIYRSGGFLEHPPFEQQNTDMFAFFVKGQFEKLQKIIDNELNAVSRKQGQYNFKPLSEYIVLSFAKINHTFSTHPKDYQKGYGEEIDVCFWIPVINIKNKNGKDYIDEFFWYAPYVWVNNPIAMIAGRNIYGYPKTIGEFIIPTTKNPNFFKANVESFKTFTPETCSKKNHILSIKNRTPKKNGTKKWGSLISAMKGIYGITKEYIPLNPTKNTTKQIKKLLLQPQIPQLFLKQFPDQFADRAVYQALVTAPAKINNFKSGGLLLGEYELNIEDVASIPLADTLGLDIGIQDIPFGFWLNFGFSVSEGKVIADNMSPPSKEKIAILGGGPASCSAAFALTSQEGWEKKYEITLYQQGWRLGGKCASGRNRTMGDRIEEHGLHVLLGFYRNTFHLIEEIYKELDRPEGSPLKHWDDALKPHNFIVLMENINDQWLPWCINFPIKEGSPCEGEESISLWQLTSTLYAWIKDWMKQLRHELELILNKKKQKPTKKNNLHKNFSQWINEDLGRTSDDIEKITQGLIKIISIISDGINKEKKESNYFFKQRIKEIKKWIKDEILEFIDENNELRRLYITLDLSLSILLGMISDDVFDKGFDAINNIDFRDWLKKHGANIPTTVQSAPVRALYDLIFAYQDGDPQKPNVEAGTCLRGMLRLIFCYKGGVMWKMQAGMGDTVFMPIYQVLKKRGVNFKFFHEIEDIVLNPKTPNTVQEIHIKRQVDLTDGPDSYHPIINIKGLSCWPNKPLYNQVIPEQAELLTNHSVDLEDFWSNWPSIYEQTYGKPLPKITLKKGKDFDIVINGTSIASLPYICSQLLAQSEKLNSCYQHVKTVATQAFQLWTVSSLQELGWDYYSSTGQQPIMTAWSPPFDTWAAMNQLLEKEDWGNFTQKPHNCAYYCGVQAIKEIPPRTDHSFTHKSKAIVKENGLEQLNNHFHSIWPKAAKPSKFDWSVLIDPDERQGKERLDAQYWRSNINPSERYVQSIVNSSQYRIDTCLPEFDNIFFTGDWIKTGINAGSVEAAVMAGYQTSRAICGFPTVIRGENDFETLG